MIILTRCFDYFPPNFSNNNKIFQLNRFKGERLEIRVQIYHMQNSLYTNSNN